jgi:hypothetical protein
VSQVFGFVQFELPGRVGPGPGRYVVRRYVGDEAQWIVVVSGHEAERRWLPGRRRPRAADAAAAAVDVTRFTLIRARPLERAALPQDVEAEVVAGLRLLNRTLAAHRVAAADPYTAEVRRDSAAVVRVGYGPGDDVAEGQWTEAVQVPPPKPARTTLSPQERLAAILAARDVVLTCEELALRAESDLAAGRQREAALELRGALEAAAVELQAFSSISGMPDRIAELGDLLTELRPLAADAMGPWDEAREELLTRALTRLRAAIRAKTAASGI